MKKLVLLISVFIPLFFIIYTSSGQGQAGSFVIQMTEDGFSPSVLTIPKGSVVIFENTDTRDRWPASNIHPTHGIYPEFDSKKPVPSGESWEFKFTQAGVWKMHDHIYSNFTGTITVEKGGTDTESLLSRISSWAKKLFSNILSIFHTEEIIPVEKDSAEIFKDENVLRAYIKKYGPDQAIKQLNALSAQFGSCHEQAHVAGRISYELLGDKAFKKCGAECHSGCYHGATEAYFKDRGTANLSKNLNTLCGDELNGFFSHQCIHGIGHGLMAWANYDIFEALKSCDLLDKRQDSCWTGVFMENIVGGLTDKSSEHFTEYLSDDPQYPCNIVDDEYKGSCYFLQTSRMIQLLNYDFTKVVEACLGAPKQYQKECFLSMGRDVGGVFRKNAPGAINACATAKGDNRIYCLDGAIQDTFWDTTGQDDAIGFCKLLTDKKEKNYCYNLIFSRAPQVLSNNEFENFCAKAEKEYQALCPKHSL